MGKMTEVLALRDFDAAEANLTELERLLAQMKRRVAPDALPRVNVRDTIDLFRLPADLGWVA